MKELSNVKIIYFAVGMGMFVTAGLSFNLGNRVELDTQNKLLLTAFGVAVLFAALLSIMLHQLFETARSLLGQVVKAKDILEYGQEYKRVGTYDEQIIGVLFPDGKLRFVLFECALPDELIDTKETVRFSYLKEEGDPYTTTHTTPPILVCAPESE